MRGIAPVQGELAIWRNRASLRPVNEPFEQTTSRARGLGGPCQGPGHPVAQIAQIRGRSLRSGPARKRAIKLAAPRIGGAGPSRDGRTHRRQQGLIRRKRDLNVEYLGRDCRAAQPLQFRNRARQGSVETRQLMCWINAPRAQIGLG